MSVPMTAASADVQDLLQRPLADASTSHLARLFATGAKRLEEWLLGIEIELLPHHDLDRPVCEHETLERVLESVRNTHPFEGEYEANDKLVGLRGDGQLVSLEPGGQVEYATRPFRTLRRLRREVTEFCGALAQAAREHDVRFWAMGHHPFADRESIARMPKDRYNVMRTYLAKRGSRALDMMHLTGSVQCAVDFSDERNMTDKVRTAARISPFVAALTASSPFSGGRANGYRSVRYEIWRNTDNSRCGLWPEMVDEHGLTFARYIEHAMNAPAMLFRRGGRHRIAEPKPYSFYAAHGFEDTTVTVGDFIDHLTTMFPEVRTKSYVELRGADCLPPVDAVAVAAFWRAVLDDEDTRLEAEDRVQAMDYAALIELQEAVARVGLSATSPAGPVREVVPFLFEAAHRCLERRAPDCAECVEPLLERAEAGLSLADEMLAQPSIEDALRLVTLQ